VTATYDERPSQHAAAAFLVVRLRQFRQALVEKN
jgi:hypothetical protein